MVAVSLKKKEKYHDSDVSQVLTSSEKVFMKISLSIVTRENRSSTPESVILFTPFDNHYYKTHILQYTPLENQENIGFFKCFSPKD